MMASTTVFVLEPGVTALGDDHGDRVDQDGGVGDDGSSLSGFGNLKVKISSPKFGCSLLSHLEILRQSSRACNVLPPELEKSVCNTTDRNLEPELVENQIDK